MSNAAKYGEIGPYLDPGYWEGHSLGIGDTIPKNVPHSKGAMSSALASVAMHVARSKDALEVTPLALGETFDASEHPSGTVVLFHCENLHSHIPVEPVEPADFEGAERPQRPALLDEIAVVDRATRHYLSIPMIGAVARVGARRRPALYTIAYSGVERFDEGALIVSPVAGLHLPMTMGETRHFRERDRGQGPLESLERISDLRIYSPTKSSRATEPRLGWSLGRLLHRGAEA